MTMFGALKLNVVEKINDHVFLKRFDRVGKLKWTSFILDLNAIV